MNEAQILLVAAASIAFLHTILGPDHYVVFTAMGKARNWSLAKTLRVTVICGMGHVLSSVLIGALGLPGCGAFALMYPPVIMEGIIIVSMIGRVANGQSA